MAAEGRNVCTGNHIAGRHCRGFDPVGGRGAAAHVGAGSHAATAVRAADHYRTAVGRAVGGHFRWRGHTASASAPSPTATFSLLLGRLHRHRVNFSYISLDRFTASPAFYGTTREQDVAGGRHNDSETAKEERRIEFCLLVEGL